MTRPAHNARLRQPPGQSGAHCLMNPSRISAARTSLAGWLLTAAFTTSLAAEAPFLPLTLSLDNALQMGNEFNPRLNEAREKLVEQDGSLMMTESTRLPDIEALGLYQWEESGRSGSFGGSSDPDREQWRAGLQVRQPIYSGGRIYAAVRANRFETEALAAEITAIQSGVMTEIHRQFYDALLAREVIAVQKESINLLGRQLKLARNRFEAGAGPRFDVLQAEVRLANARPPLIRAENNYRNAIDQLRTSLGAIYSAEATPDDITIEGALVELPQALDLDEALSLAWLHRPELKAMEQRRMAAEQNLRFAHAQRSPSFGLFADYSIENDRYSPDADPLDGWRAGVEANLTLWDGGRIRGEIVRAQSRLQQTSLQHDHLRLDIELEVRNAWNRAQEAEEILTAAELVITQAEEALRLAENRYGVGALTQLDVLSSQLEFTKAKLDRITAVHDYNVALVELERSVGRLPGASVLDPDSNPD